MEVIVLYSCPLAAWARWVAESREAKKEKKKKKTVNKEKLQNILRGKYIPEEKEEFSKMLDIRR